MIDKGKQVKDIFKLAREAGHQLVREGTISSQSLATISRILIYLEMHEQFRNQRAQEALSAQGNNQAHNFESSFASLRFLRDNTSLLSSSRKSVYEIVVKSDCDRNRNSPQM